MEQIAGDLDTPMVSAQDGGDADRLDLEHVCEEVCSAGDHC